MLHHALMSFLLLAQQEGDGGTRPYSISWAIIVLSVILGLVPALRPAKREETVKKPKKVAE